MRRTTPLTNEQVIQELRSGREAFPVSEVPQDQYEACVEAVILEDPEQRGFADAARWAAFAYVGG